MLCIVGWVGSSLVLMLSYSGQWNRKCYLWLIASYLKKLHIFDGSNFEIQNGGPKF